MKSKITDEIWNKFINHCVAVQQLSSSTIEETLRKLRFLEKHEIDLFANKEELKNKVYAHFAERIRNGTPGKTLNGYVKALNRWLRYREIDFRFIKYKANYSPRRIPSTSEIKKIIDVCSGRDPIAKRDKTIIYFLSQSGLRAEELCNLNLDDVDWENLKITIRGKGGKIRRIPVSYRVMYGKNVPSLFNYIKYHRIPSDKKAFFTTKKGRLSPKYLRTIIKKRAKKAGLSWVHTHSFRHYYATNLLRAGKHIKIVSYLLGHSDIKTTGIYLHIVESDLEGIMEDEKIEDPFRIKNKKHGKIGKYLQKHMVKSEAGSAGFDINYRRDFVNTIEFFGNACNGGIICVS